MRIGLDTADALLARVVARTGDANGNLFGTLDELDAPIYVTDAEGFVTYFNRACIGFTGRTPAVGKDRWCVTWKLYTADGDYLPHDQCPMAQAIRSGKPVRGMTAVAARPDGTRVQFAPFPTPFFDAARKVAGAINILLDVSDVRQAAELQTQGERCMRLAAGVVHDETAKALTDMAAAYERKARALTASGRLL